MRRRWLPLGLPLILFACAPVEPPVSTAPVDAGTVTVQASAPEADVAPTESAEALRSAWQATAPEPSDDGGLTHATAPALLSVVEESEDAGSSLSLSTSTGSDTEALPGEEEPQVITESEVPVLELGPDGEPLIDADDDGAATGTDAFAHVLDGGSAPGSPVVAVGSDPNAPVANDGAEPSAPPITGTDGDEDAVAEAPLAEVDAGMEPYAIPYAPDAGSLRVRRSITVRSEPRQDSPSLGTVAQDMRVMWQGAMRGPDCDTWVQLQPRGWVCERYLEQNFRAPRVRPLPRVEEGALTPGVYARVVGYRVRAYPSLALARRKKQGVLLKGSVTVKLLGQVKVGRRTFWRTSDGQYFEARVLREHRPSDFSGLDAEALASLPMPFAWAQSRAAPRTDVVVRKAPDARAERETALPPRTLVSVRELSPDGQWVRIAEDHWVARDDLHVAWPLASPSIVEPGARWLDVDLEAQTLIAYEGDRPVYATLISSGKPGTDTPEGLFRIWVKYAEADMTGTMGKASYRVATVPWTMFFEGDFALHTAYWHDRFGEPVSHGCINLAPKDARALYGWTTPDVPAGWSMVHAMPDDPGTWVRIRGQAHEAPKKRRKGAPVVASVRDL